MRLLNCGSLSCELCWLEARKLLSWIFKAVFTVCNDHWAPEWLGYYSNIWVEGKMSKARQVKCFINELKRHFPSPFQTPCKLDDSVGWSFKEKGVRFSWCQLTDRSNDDQYFGCYSQLQAKRPSINLGKCCCGQRTAWWDKNIPKKGIWAGRHFGRGLQTSFGVFLQEHFHIFWESQYPSGWEH